MRRLIHISDLHFGRENPQVVEALLEEIRLAAPDLVVISGDLTQRARTAQFEKAAEFLNRLTARYLVVPGNHDHPLYQLPLRLFRPLMKYKRFIQKETEPEYIDPELCVLGIDSTNPYQWKEGRWRERHLRRIKSKFSPASARSLRILVMHHPPDLDSGVLQDILSAEPDLLLSGHLHIAGATLARPKAASSTLILSAAGTAVSRRLRGESNSFNVIEVSDPVTGHMKPSVRIEARVFEGDAFHPVRSQFFVHGAQGWHMPQTELER